MTCLTCLPPPGLPGLPGLLGLPGPPILLDLPSLLDPPGLPGPPAARSSCRGWSRTGAIASALPILPERTPCRPFSTTVPHNFPIVDGPLQGSRTRRAVRPCELSSPSQLVPQSRGTPSDRAAAGLYWTDEGSRSDPQIRAGSIWHHRCGSPPVAPAGSDRADRNLVHLHRSTRRFAPPPPAWSPAHVPHSSRPPRPVDSSAPWGPRVSPARRTRSSRSALPRRARGRVEELARCRSGCRPSAGPRPRSTMLARP